MYKHTHTHSQITRGGAAHATGKLRLGDRILEVWMGVS